MQYGRLSKTTARAIRHTAVSRPALTAREIQQEVGASASTVSLNTVRHYLREAGMVVYRPVAAPALTAPRGFSGHVNIKRGPLKIGAMSFSAMRQHWR